MAIRYLSATDPKRLSGTAILRLDFNTEDDWRMRAVLPTIKFLLKGSCKILIISHRGRPNGVDRNLSLKKDAGALAKMLGKKVTFLAGFNFPAIKKTIDDAPDNAIFLLENLRFMPGEEKDDPKFAAALAALGDFYVNDAFAVSHRANASVAAITNFLPSCAGLELENEIKFLGAATIKPKRPVVLIIGGAKAGDKLGVMKYFKNKADWFLLGGGSANTILSLKGMDVKESIKDSDPKEQASLKAVAGYKNMVLPEDFAWHEDAILDLGPKTTKKFVQKIAQAHTIIWSGPLGLIEKKAYATSSIAVARAIVSSRKAFTLSGGGETVMFLKKYGFDKKFTFISTGGGAMLDFLAGKKLPGLEALRRTGGK